MPCVHKYCGEKLNIGKKARECGCGCDFRHDRERTPL